MSTRYPRPEILDRIPLTHHAVIEASAGTGKTFTIEHLVVEILLEGVTLEQIVVLTFTEKATAELKRRIRAMLAKILTGGAVASGPAWEIDEGARKKLEAALLAFDTAAIHTIHGFFQRVLTSNAFAIGRPLDQEMVDGRTAFHRAFLAVVRGEAATDPELRRYLTVWLEQEEKKLDALEDLLYRCLPYHRRGTPYHPEYRPAELARCVESEAPATCPDPESIKGAMQKPNISTAKSVATRLEKIHRAVGAFQATGDQLALLSSLGEKHGSDPGSVLDVVCDKLATITWKSGLLDGWAAFLERLRGLTVSFESAAVQRLMPPLVRQLDTDRAAQGQFDFDDLIRLVWDALNGPGAAALAASLRGRYRYALVDEFQDTDDLQWKIFERLFFQRTGHVCYLVGDPKQAIYSFRGADVHAYIEATQVVSALHDQPPVALDRSFRSTPVLIGALNTIFDQSAAEPFFTDPAIRYNRPVTAGKADLRLTEAGQDAAPIVVLEVDAGKVRAATLRRALARTIAADIARVLGDRPLALDGKTVTASGIYVLTRGGAEGLVIGEALREVGVPHAFYKQDGLFQTAEAADLRDVLMAVEDPSDRSRRFRAWLSPFFDVPLAALAALAELPHQHPLVSQLEEWHDLARRREFERLFTALADDSGLVRRLLESRHERELTNTLHLLEIMLAQAQSGARLGDLIVDLTAYIAGERLPPGEDPNVQRLESDRDAVQIMTMHKSKGLEADLVYMFGGFSPPPARGIEPVLFHADGRRVLHLGRDARALAERDLEAERENQRLLYVALTRARGRVVLPLLPEVRRGAPYACVNRRLALVKDAPGFERRPVALDGAAAVVVTPVPVDAPLTWPAEPDGTAERQEIESLRHAHRALEMTSYSRIKRAHGGYVSPMDADRFKGDVVATDPLVVPAVEPDALPGGVAMGILLHEVIEVVPLETLKGDDAEAWARDPRVAEVVGETLARHGADLALRPAIERLVFRALTCPVQLGDQRLPAFASVARSAREMEFTFPYPERGFVQGVIDLVFEHDGRYYFADWKTDILPDYGDAAVRAHVARNYRLQAQLYALAMIKLLGIADDAQYQARFGGMLYCFLRGMQTAPGGSPGVYFERPAWDELVAFAKQLESGGELA